MPGPAFGVHIRAKWEMRLVWWGIVHDWIKEIGLDSVDGGSQQGCLSRTEHCENKMKEWLVKPAASSTGVTSEVQTQSWQALVGTGIHCPPTLANATVRDAVQSLQATARKTRTHASPSFLTQSWFLCLGPYMPQPGHPPL